LKISLTKLKRVTDGYNIIGVNIDSLPEKTPLTEEIITKLCKQKEELFKEFETRDLDTVPMAILSHAKNIMSAFIYKIIGDDE